MLLSPCLPIAVNGRTTFFLKAEKHGHIMCAIFSYPIHLPEGLEAVCLGETLCVTAVNRVGRRFFYTLNSFFGYIARDRVIRENYSFPFNSLRILHTVFHGCLAITLLLAAHRVPFFYRPPVSCFLSPLSQQPSSQM